MKRLHIAHVTATFPPYLSGAGMAAFHLAGGLARRGHEIEVLTAEAPGPAPPCDAQVRRMRPLLAVGNAPLLPSLGRLQGYDVVHLHLPFIFGSELLLAGRCRGRHPPLVMSYHNRLVGDGLRRPLFAVYEATMTRIILRGADRVCVVSADHADSIAALRRLPPERLVVVPNGVDLDAFSPPTKRPAAREALGFGPEKVIAVVVATLDRAHHFKRVDRAIDALVASGERSVELVVIGDGELRRGLERHARAAGVGERVHFLGALSHERLPAVLGAVDFLILCSDKPESFGMVLVEAFACGIPVIASDLPGVRTVVRHGVDGVVAARSVEDVSDAIRAMVGFGPQHRATMGAAGRDRCVQDFTWPHVVDRLEAVYADVLGG